MAFQETLTEKIPEGSTPTITAVVQDENAAAVPGSNLTSLLLTLYEQNTRKIINGRDEQDVLNKNQVTVDESGNLTFDLLIADTPLLYPSTAGEETHVALFEFGFSGKVGKKEIIHTVANLSTE